MYHKDPGRANYGCVDPIILRFMYLCWVRTIIIQVQLVYGYILVYYQLVLFS